MRVGKHAYQSTEQAYHHIRAVSHKKPLVASRILLARDPYEIMNIGAELTSTKQLEDCEEDIMYGCILRKFEQNPELLKQLIATGHKQLVEPTPNTKWGAGATLSSNILKQRTWKGHNKHGQILMTVRDTLRNRAANLDRESLQVGNVGEPLDGDVLGPTQQTRKLAEKKLSNVSFKKK